MNKIATTAADLVPISERLRILRLYRVVVVAIAALLWVFDPITLGPPAVTAAVVTAGYIVGSLLIEVLWRMWRAPGSFLIGVLIMVDATFLAWASYGTDGLNTPLRYVVLLQLTTVALIASSRTAVKLAMWNSLLLLAAYYAMRSGLLARLGNPHVRLGAGYRDLIIEAGAYWIIALATSTLAAINERELRRRRYDLEALARLALALEEAEDPAEVGATLLSEIADAFGYERSMLVESRRGQLVPLSMLGLGADETLALEVPTGPTEVSPLPVAIGTGESVERRRHAVVPLTAPGRRTGDIAWLPIDPVAAPMVTRALEENRTLLVGRVDTQRDAVLSACVSARNAMIVPLHGDRAMGALILEHSLRHGSRVERRVVTMIERFCSHTSLALGNVNLLMQIRDQATTDMLTGLANRRALEETLARACAHAARELLPLSFAIIDIDHFKAFNDTHGHQVGDRVLQTTGKTLSQQTRASDIAARYGGEEFCVVMPGAPVEAAAETVRRLCEAITRNSGDLGVTASAGVACFGVHAHSPEQLVAAADRALYTAKREGRNRVATASGERDGALMAVPPLATSASQDG